MNDYRIVVADSSESSREKICSLLQRRGYKIYQASDGAGAIRMARSVKPHIVLLDMKIWGMRAFEVADIIEGDGLSTVIFITNSTSPELQEKLKKMKVYAYILKPVNPDQLYQIVEFAIVNSDRISMLSQKVEKLEHTLEGRKKVDRAKGMIMDKLGMTEDEAYKYIRKKSMDQCVSMDVMAEKIIEEYS